jgi:phenylpropionate dioxygenase-like ring-hydroxylating dioxygenase large terminal subunit
MYLRNVWYVAAAADEVTRTPRPFTVLGEKVAFYRTEKGEPFALEDACPHRKLPLSMGRLKGDTVECGYHGMRFDRSGACSWAPGQSRIPPNAKVKAYPVTERYGFVWIWMGDPSRANADDIFKVEHYDDPAWGVSRGDPIDIACNYLLITDNLLDPSHVAWVHQSSFAAKGTEDTPLNVKVEADGVTVSRWMLDQEVAPLYKPLVPFKGRCDRLQHYEVRFPSHANNVAYFTPAGKGGPDKPVPDDAFFMYSYNFMTPVDENNTRYFYMQVRNVQPQSAEVSKLMAEGVRAAFLEDKAVLEACQQGLKNPRVRPLDLAIDAGPLRFRRQLDKLMEREAVAVAAE